MRVVMKSSNISNNNGWFYFEEANPPFDKEVLMIGPRDMRTVRIGIVKKDSDNPFIYKIFNQYSIEIPEPIFWRPIPHLPKLESEFDNSY